MGTPGALSGESRVNAHSSSCFQGQLSKLNLWRAVTRSLRCEQALHLNGALNLKINVGGGKKHLPKGLAMLASFVSAITVMVRSSQDVVTCMSEWSVLSLKRDCSVSGIRGWNFTGEDHRPCPFSLSAFDISAVRGAYFAWANKGKSQGANSMGQPVS